MNNEVAGRLINADAWTVSAIEQDNARHNLWRYHELQKLRLGQPNRYLETSYR